MEYRAFGDFRMGLTEVVFRIKSEASALCGATSKTDDLRIIVNQTSWDDASKQSKALVTVLGEEGPLREVVNELPDQFDTVEQVRQVKDQATFRVTASLGRLQKASNPLAFVLELFGERAMFGPALIADGGVTTRLVVSGKVDLAEMLAFYETGSKQARWSDFKLVRIDDFDPEQQIHGAFTENLTQKQLEVIKTALALGFYNTPRDVTLDDLASIFGISKAAVHNRLQAAERKVIAKFFA